MLLLSRAQGVEQGVVTTNTPVEPFATGITIESNDQDVILHDQDVLKKDDQVP